MTSLAANPRVADTRSLLTEGHVASIARTYDRVSSPVWVYDLSARCVYRNPSAHCPTGSGAARVTFDIVDYAGQVVGHLATLDA